MDGVGNSQTTQKPGDWTENATVIMETGKSGDEAAGRRVKKGCFRHTEFEFPDWLTIEISNDVMEKCLVQK